MEFQTVHTSTINGCPVTLYAIDSPIGAIQILDSTDAAGKRETNFFMDAVKADTEYKRAVKRML